MLLGLAASAGVGSRVGFVADDLAAVDVDDHPRSSRKLDKEPEFPHSDDLDLGEFMAVLSVILGPDAAIVAVPDPIESPRLGPTYPAKRKERPSPDSHGRADL